MEKTSGGLGYLQKEGPELQGPCPAQLAKDFEVAIVGIHASLEAYSLQAMFPQLACQVICTNVGLRIQWSFSKHCRPENLHTPLIPNRKLATYNKMITESNY